MRKLTIWAVLATLFFPLSLRAQEAQKREVRTVWVATVSNIDWPRTRGTSATVIANQKKQLTDLLDGFVKANMNGICLQVRPMADALYHSSYEPFSSYVSGTRGVDPGWDPLEFAVEECHKRGLECHAWVNPYRFSNNYGNDCNTPQDLAMKSSGLLMQVDKYVVFNPGLKGSRDHLVKVCKEMIQNYDIDGIIFDDYFYPGGGTPTNNTAPDYDLWAESGTSMTIADWRRHNVNLMVQDMYDMVQETKPYVKFGIGPAGVAGTASTSAGAHGVTPCPTGSDWQYNQIYSDPLAWLEEGTIDYISPQLYWKTNHSTNPFGPLTQWWSYIANHYGRHHYASHNIYFMESTNTLADWQEICQQIQYSRDYNLDNAPGVNFYSAKYIDGPACSGLADYLASTLFTHKALNPPMTWKPKLNFNAPENLELNDGELSWTAVDQPLIRYSVYAVPDGMSPDEVQSQKFDGIKSDYLIGVTYSPSFELPSEYTSGYWYAVCVVDGWGNEFDAAYLDAPVDYAQKVTLLSPVGGAVAQWVQQFTWTAADAATYRIQVASDPDFSNIILEERNLTTNNVSLDLDTLESSKTYYWRVATRQSGYLDCYSDVATFTSPERTSAPLTTLVSPADGAEITDNFDFVFTKVNADSYRVEVASDRNFQSIVYTGTDVSETGGSMHHTMVVGILGKGTFYWRVATNARYCTEAVTSSRSFTVTSIPVGETEPGYVIKKDIDNNSYTMQHGLKLNNLWVRSVKSEYDNITFDSDGLMNRGFAVKGNRIYQAGRVEGSSTAATYLRVYNATTGERIQDVQLAAEVSVPYYPANDVLTDAAGNLVVTNLSLNIGSTPLMIFQIDENTGNATLRARLTANNVTSKPRIDHCNVLGDVSSGNFKVFAATASGTELIRWTITNGNVTATEVKQVAGFAPSSNTSFGIAPRIYPVSDNIVYVNGGATYLTRYNFATGAIDGSFSAGELVSSNNQANGAAIFDFGGRNYLLYSYGDFNAPLGHQFMLVENANDWQFSGFSKMWLFPAQGLGDLNSATWGAPCLVTPGSDKFTKNLYLYVPGNGMAAYELKSLKGDVNGDGQVNVSDVTALINMILGVLPVDQFRGDINDDDDVNVNDVTSLINIILGIL
ncbi:MAG: family 10 glycosylhydrolase [Muribaculaceae bacterium]|nr:family 10 glycosylhydrolase [Muribaculaceae bacterium]